MTQTVAIHIVANLQVPDTYNEKGACADRNNYAIQKVDLPAGDRKTH